MISFVPDSVETLTAQQAQDKFEFTFNGPGFYHFNGNTYLVVPLNRRASELWHDKKDAQETFQFNIYNERAPDDAFDLISAAPSRIAF